MPINNEQPVLMSVNELVEQGYPEEVAATHPANEANKHVDPSHTISRVDLITQGYPPEVAATHPANPDKVTLEDYRAGARSILQRGMQVLDHEHPSILENRGNNVPGNK